MCVLSFVCVLLLLRACNSRLGAVAELSSADWRGPTWPHRLGQHDPISDNCDPYFICRFFCVFFSWFHNIASHPIHSREAGRQRQRSMTWLPTTTTLRLALHLALQAEALQVRPPGRRSRPSRSFGAGAVAFETRPRRRRRRRRRRRLIIRAPEPLPFQ